MYPFPTSPKWPIMRQIFDRSPNRSLGGESRRRWMRRFALLMALATIASAWPANAQILRQRLRPPQEPETEAYAGEPYGVGRWTVQLPQGVNPAILGNSGFTLTDKSGRTVFQAFQAEPLRTAARELLGRPQTANVYFLFTGDAPLELQLYSPTAATTTITPVRDPVNHERLLTDWWVRYTRQANRLGRPADYPPMVDNYLLATLSRRLNLPPASQIPPSPIRLIADSLISGVANGGIPKSPATPTGDEQANHQISLFFGSDALRSELQTKVLLRQNDAPEIADQPIPAAIQFSAKVPEVIGDIAIEPIANHIPAECFYIRYGSFANYQWFRNTLDRWSGDLQNLINRRGLDYGITPRVERQLSLKENVLAPILGPAVIADVAMTGTDMFFREGASIGFLFQARNNFALNSDFTQQRTATLQRESGCTDEQIDIAGHKVSFLSTPDNRVRSFYAVDGDFHLVTNSRWLVERFFEASAGKNSLGASAEFRLARSLMPINRDYTVFAYLSSAFFQNLASPHYQLEMDRRLRSTAEIDMAMVAQLAARGDSVNATSPADLIKAQYLPQGFGERADGSKLQIAANGEFYDTLRGAALHSHPCQILPSIKSPQRKLSATPISPPGCNRNGRRSIPSSPPSAASPVESASPAPNASFSMCNSPRWLQKTTTPLPPPSDLSANNDSPQFLAISYRPKPVSAAIFWHPKD